MAVFVKQSSVLQFLNPWIMVKKGGKLPVGHINDWFWEDKSMQDYIATRLPKGMYSGQGHNKKSWQVYHILC